MKTCGGSTGTIQEKAPAMTGRGFFDVSVGRLSSIAAIDQPPARSPRRRDKLPHIAAAIAIAVGRAAGDEAGPPPAVMPSAVPTVTAPGGGGGRRQRGHA